MLKNKALLVRWDERFDKTKNRNWWHVIKDDPEDIMMLKGKVRNMIRRGERDFEAAKCDRDTILKEGYSVYTSSFSRYDTFEVFYSEDQFKEAITNLPVETEFWSVRTIEEKKLVAFSENLVMNGACFYLSMWLVPEYMKSFSGYLLFHKMNAYYLNSRKLSYVSDGARSISHNTNIHEFLVTKFGFRRAYSDLKIVYFPGLYLVIILLLPLCSVTRKINNSFFRKISVLLEQEKIRKSCKM